MSKKTAIWILGISGWLISYAMFGKWLAANDGGFFGGWVDAFTSSDFSTGLHLDLVFCSVMMIALAIYDRRRLGGRWAAGVVAALCLSVSMSLAIYGSPDVLVGPVRSDVGGMSLDAAAA